LTPSSTPKIETRRYLPKMNGVRGRGHTHQPRSDHQLLKGNQTQAKGVLGIVLFLNPPVPLVFKGEAKVDAFGAGLMGETRSRGPSFPEPPSLSPLIYDKGGWGDKENVMNERVVPADGDSLLPNISNGTAGEPQGVKKLNDKETTLADKQTVPRAPLTALEVLPISSGPRAIFGNSGPD